MIESCFLMAANLRWDEFITENLLKKKLTDGVSVLTKTGNCVYSQGTLEVVSPENWNKLRSVIVSLYKGEGNNLLSSIVLHIGNKTFNYKAYQKTYCSLYAVTEGGTEGLIVNHLPHGILVCTYSQPQQANQVIQMVEEFCDLLRA